MFIDIRNRELAEMQFGNLSEGCGLSMVHAIPIFSVSAVTLFAIALEKQVSFAEVSKQRKKKEFSLFILLILNNCI